MAEQARLPQWSTFARRLALIDLFCRSGGFCVFGHTNCLTPEHHYELYSEDLIADWKQADRETAIAEFIAEQRAMHSLAERPYPLRGQFSAISKEIWGGDQPLFYIQCLGMSGLTLRPYAKVRVSSSFVRLLVDLGDTLRSVSKSKRRKAVRYGKPLPLRVEARILQEVRQAVKHYYDH